MVRAKRLAFFASLGNNPFDPVMRLACGLAIALWLSFPAAGMDSRQQDPADSAKAAAQTPSAPAPPKSAPAETAPAETAPPEQVPAEVTPPAVAHAQTPAAGKKAPDAETKKMEGGSAGGTSARGPSPGGTPSNGTRKRSPRTVSAPDGSPRKIVVREGGASEPAAQIAPGMTPAEAARQRQNAEQLLASTGDQLKLLAERTLDGRQQETMAQIRNYMDGAHSALKDGDVRRANTLALKAHLLSEELVRY